MKQTGRTTGRSRWVAALTIGALVATTNIAFADNTQSDGDGVTPLNDSDWALGEVCVNELQTKSVPVYINRNGSSTGTNTFKNGTTVTVSVLSTTNATASMSSNPATITLPADWQTKGNGTKSDTVSAFVSVTPTATGDFTGSVAFRGSGLNTGGSTIDRDDSMNITGTAVVCTAADTTKPVIAPTIIGTAGDNGWYTGDVKVTWSVSDPESGVASSSGCDETDITADTAGTVLTCSATNGAGLSDSETVTIKRDASTPVIAPTITGTAGDNGWYTGDVKVTWSVSDPESGVASSLGCGETDITADTAGAVLTCSATNGAGLSDSETVTIKRDATKPVVTVTGATDGSTYYVGSTVPALTDLGCSTSDTMSGVATPATLTAPNAISLGSNTVTCSGAKDDAGNTNSKTITFNVQYQRDGGIGAPINLDGRSLFSIKRAVPVKFQLANDAPSGFSTTGFKLIRAGVACPGTTGGADNDVDEQPLNASTGWRYDATADQYVFNASLAGASAGKCYRYSVDLGDGGSKVESAVFQVGK